MFMYALVNQTIIGKDDGVSLVLIGRLNTYLRGVLIKVEFFIEENAFQNVFCNFALASMC